MSSAVATRAYREVGRNHSMRRALLAYLCFTAQEFAIWIAVTLYAYDRGGATAAGLVCVAMLVPAAFVAPLGSVLGDRIRRDHALAIGYVVQAVAAGALALALAFAPPALAYLAAIVSACAVTLTRPVHNAILPELSETPEQLTAANSITGTTEGLGLIIGPLVNSVVIAAWGPGAVCGIFAVTMLAAAGMTFRLTLRPVAADPSTLDGHRSIARDVLEAASVLRLDVPAGALTLFGGGQYFVVGLLDVFYAVLAVDILALGDGGAGVLAASVGLGALVGALATAVLIGRARLATYIEIAVGLMAGALASVAVVQALGPIVLLLAAVGAARSFFDVAARTLLQRSVPDAVLARVFGLQEALVMLALAAGSAAAPIFVALFGNRGAFLAVGALAVLAGVTVFPALQLLDRRAFVPDPERIALLRSVPMFALLEQPRLERIAASMLPLQIPAGEAFIRAGDEGDRFYLIGEGEADVWASGRALATVRRGGYVGEIALLRDVPRTADVVARTDLTVLALERSEFLGALSDSGLDLGSEEADRRLEELHRLDGDAG